MSFFQPVILGGVLDGIADALRDAAQKALNSCFELYFKLSDFSTAFSDDYGIMPKLVLVGNEFKVVDGAIDPLIEVGSSFGVCFALIFMIIGMVDTYMQEKMSLETFIKPFLQYFGTVALLINARTLIAALWSFGFLLAAQIKNVTGDGSMAAAVEVSLTGDMSFGAIFGLLIGSFVIMVLAAVLGLIIRLCAYIANFSRMIEAAVRAVGVGIAIGISADSSFKQGAVRYLKKFLAVSLQGGMFAAIATIYTAASIACIQTNIRGNTDTVGDGMAYEEGHYEDIAPEVYESQIRNIIEGVDTFIEEERNALIEITGSGDDALVVALTTVLGNIIPLAGLGLGAIVVLFKSGQICNDIVGV